MLLSMNKILSSSSSSSSAVGNQSALKCGSRKVASQVTRKPSGQVKYLTNILFIFIFLFYLYTYPPNSQESDRGANA